MWQELNQMWFSNFSHTIFLCLSTLQHFAVLDSHIYLNLFCLFIVQLYRLERYNECKSVYTDLIRNSQDEYEEERKTNLAAVVASISQWEDTPLVSSPPQQAGKWSYTHFVFLISLSSLLQEDLGLPESSYELCYNAACTLIGQGQLTEAFNKLRQAEGQSRSEPFYSSLLLSIHF